MLSGCGFEVFRIFADICESVSGLLSIFENIVAPGSNGVAGLPVLAKYFLSNAGSVGIMTDYQAHQYSQYSPCQWPLFLPPLAHFEGRKQRGKTWTGGSLLLSLTIGPV